MRVRWRRTALAELTHLKAYLHQRSPQAAEAVVARIKQRIEGLVVFPEACPMIGLGAIRKLVISGTSYVAYYDIRGPDIRVIALFHASQDRPWKEYSFKSEE